MENQWRISGESVENHWRITGKRPNLTPLSCPTYDEFPVVFSPLQLRSLTYSSPPPPTGWTIRELRMVVYPRELASAFSQDPIVSDEGEGDNVGQSRFQLSPVVSNHI